jgi:hypothetical protein
MPVQETVDAVAQLRAEKLPLGSVIVNMSRPPLLPEPALVRAATGKVDLKELRSGLTAAGLDPKLATALAGEAVEHAERWEVEDRNRATLAELGLPTTELPFLPGPVDLGGLYELAGLLRPTEAAA